MIYELRQYLTERGRMVDQHDRMKNHTPSLLEKHGVRVVGRWAALSGPRMPSYLYVMEWRDFAEREACWASFYADPEWARVRAQTNAGSEMVEENNLSFLRPNSAFIQDEGAGDQRIAGLHQLITQKILPGQNPAVAAFLDKTYLPRVREAGARVIAVCDMISGPTLPALVILIAWSDEAAWRSGWQRFEADPAMIKAYQAQRESLGTTLFGGYESLLLEPASYALPVASFRHSPR